MRSTSDKSTVALIPISLDSKLFRTSVMAPALVAIGGNFSNFLFLIADSLQIYNKLWSTQHYVLGNAFENFERLRKSYLAERVKWIDRLCKNMKGAHPRQWMVRSSYEFMDAAFWRVYQRILILYCMSKEMRKDVERVAIDHTRKQKLLKASAGSIRLSEAYLLEELALSVRVRVFEKIGSEFYLGQYPKPLLHLYDSRYGIDVGALAGRKTGGLEFYFFSWCQDDGKQEWTQANRPFGSE